MLIITCSFIRPRIVNMACTPNAHNSTSQCAKCYQHVLISQSMQKCTIQILTIPSSFLSSKKNNVSASNAGVSLRAFITTEKEQNAASISERPNNFKHAISLSIHHAKSSKNYIYHLLIVLSVFENKNLKKFAYCSRNEKIQ